MAPSSWFFQNVDGLAVLCEESFDPISCERSGKCRPRFDNVSCWVSNLQSRCDCQRPIDEFIFLIYQNRS